MPPARQPQLRSAVRQIVQHSSKSTRPFAKRKFHQVFGLGAPKTPEDRSGPVVNTCFPRVQGEVDLEKSRACRREKNPYGNGQERFQSLTDKQAGLLKNDEPTADLEDTSPNRDEFKDLPAHERALFYGSASRRRQRATSSKNSKDVEKRQAPEWFINWNVQLADVQPSCDGPVGLDQPLLEGIDPPSPGVPPISAEVSETGSPFGEEFATPISREEKLSAYGIQLRELEAVTRGLLRVPVTNRNSSAGAHHEGPHLILDHQEAEVRCPSHVWRDAIEGLASKLNCDLVTLNAQDIGELIATADLGDEITSQALSLNYEITEKMKKLHLDSSNINYGNHTGQTTREEFANDTDDYEEMPFDFQSLGLGTPLMIGKPITIDLTKIMNTRFGKNGLMGDQTAPSSIVSSLFDMKQNEFKRRHSNHLLGSVVSGVLSAVELRRFSNEEKSTVELERGSDGVPYFQPSRVTSDLSATSQKLLIYIQTLDLLHDHSLGHQFLSELYVQVHNRRLHGQGAIIIAAPPFQNGIRSEWLESIDIQNASRRVELASPEASPESAALLRKANLQQNTATNYRNLRMMMRTKLKDESWEFYDPRSPNFLEDVSKVAFMPQTSALWDLQYVQRLAAVLWGFLESEPQSAPSITKAMALLDQSDRIKIDWQKRRSRDQFQLRATVEDTRIASIRSTATKHEKALLAGVIEPSRISVTFRDVHAPLETIEAIQTLTTLSLIRPEAFRYGVLASDRLPGLLLYGPPGTGKTLLAKAVAKESGATVLSVSSAQLNDMYVGEGEKNVAALFTLAKKLTPCVIFLDEADAIFSARSNRGHRVNHRELLNQFLAEWDGMSNDASGAFIMVATNRPMDLDDAVLRRLPRRLLVDLPTEIDRLAILKIHLREEVLDTDVDLADLARKTPFYSGSDLKNLAVAAALECVRQENEAAKNYTGNSPFQYPEKRTLTVKHFEKALSEISASISEDMASLREIKKFDEQYGDKRGRKRKAARWGFSSAAEADKVLDTVKVRG